MQYFKSIYLRILAEGILVILQSKTYHPMFHFKMLDTISKPQSSKADVRSAKKKFKE